MPRDIVSLHALQGVQLCVYPDGGGVMREGDEELKGGEGSCMPLLLPLLPLLPLTRPGAANAMHRRRWARAFGHRFEAKRDKQWGISSHNR